MKFKGPEFIDFWNKLKEIADLNMDLDPVLSSWMKRFFVMGHAEVEFWNSLDKKERKIVSRNEFEIDVHTIPSKHCPEWFPPQYKGTFAKIFEGDIPQPKTRMEMILESKQKEVNTDE